MSLLELPSDIIRLISGLIKDSIYDLRLTCRALSMLRVAHYRAFTVNSNTPAVLIATRTNITIAHKLLLLLNYLDLKHVRRLMVFKQVELDRKNFPNLRNLCIWGGAIDLQKIPDWVETVELSGKFEDIEGDIPRNISWIRVKNHIKFAPKSSNLKKLTFLSEPIYCKVPDEVTKLHLVYTPTMGASRRIVVNHKLHLVTTNPLDEYFDSISIPHVCNAEFRVVGNTWIISSSKLISVLTQESVLDLASLNLPPTKLLRITSAEKIENYRIASGIPADITKITTVSNIPACKKLFLIRCKVAGSFTVSKLTVFPAVILEYETDFDLTNISNLKIVCTGLYNELNISQLSKLRKLEISIRFGEYKPSDIGVLISLPSTLEKLVMCLEKIYYDLKLKPNKKVIIGERLTELLKKSNTCRIVNDGVSFQISPYEPAELDGFI